MKHIILTFFVFSISLPLAFCQDVEIINDGLETVKGDSLIIEKKRFATRSQFKFESKVVPVRKLNDFYRIDKSAHTEFRKAKNARNISILCKVTGAILVGVYAGIAYSQPEVLAYSQVSLAPMYVGFGLTIVSFPLDIKYNKHARNAMGIFNKGKEVLK